MRPGDRRRRADELAIEQRQLGVDAGDRAFASFGSVDAQRDALGEDDVEDPVVQVVLEQPVGDRALRWTHVGRPLDRLGGDRLDPDDVVLGDRPALGVGLADLDGGRAGVVDDDEDVVRALGVRERGPQGERRPAGRVVRSASSRSSDPASRLPQRLAPAPPADCLRPRDLARYRSAPGRAALAARALPETTTAAPRWGAAVGSPNGSGDSGLGLLRRATPAVEQGRQAGAEQRPSRSARARRSGRCWCSCRSRG